MNFFNHIMILNLLMISTAQAIPAASHTLTESEESTTTSRKKKVRTGALIAAPVSLGGRFYFKKQHDDETTAYEQKPEYDRDKPGSMLKLELRKAVDEGDDSTRKTREQEIADRASIRSSDNLTRICTLASVGSALLLALPQLVTTPISLLARR